MRYTLDFQQYVYLQTRFGALCVCARNTGLCEVAFLTKDKVSNIENFSTTSKNIFSIESNSIITILQTFIDWLRDYEACHFRNIDFPLDFGRSSAFEQKILLTCLTIPPGQTRTYRQLAVDAGLSPSYARAVARVMANNHLPLVIPCHRVVASNGFGGYGPGVSVKITLLQHEALFPFHGGLP